MSHIPLQLAEATSSWNPIELFDKGGILMWPLLLLSLISAIVVFTCLWTTRRSAVLPDNIVSAVEVYIRKKDYAGLTAACAYDGSNFAKIIHVVVMFLQRNPRASMEEVREVAISEGSRQSMNLTRQISWLSDIASIAPMIGLLGTVIGMMSTFVEMAEGNFEGVKQMKMASGISEALITTASGLVLAIPTMAAFYYFRNRIQKNITDMEVATTHILSIIAVQIERERRLGNSANTGMFSEELLGE